MDDTLHAYPDHHNPPADASVLDLRLDNLVVMTTVTRDKLRSRRLSPPRYYIDGHLPRWAHSFRGLAEWARQLGYDDLTEQTFRDAEQGRPLPHLHACWILDALAIEIGGRTPEVPAAFTNYRRRG